MIHVEGSPIGGGNPRHEQRWRAALATAATGIEPAAAVRPHFRVERHRAVDLDNLVWPALAGLRDAGVFARGYRHLDTISTPSWPPDTRRAAGVCRNGQPNNDRFSGKPDVAWDDEVAREALVSALITDALAIINCVPAVGLAEEAERTVASLASVAGQDVEPRETPGQWRIARAVAKDPGRVGNRSRVAARAQDQVVAATATRRTSQSSPRPGSSPPTPPTPPTAPNTVSPGHTADGDAATDLLADEDVPVEVLTDAAYGSGQTRAELDDAGHTTVIKPMTNTTAGRVGAQSGRCCRNGVGITR